MITINTWLLLLHIQLVEPKPAENPACSVTDAYDRHVDTVYRVCLSIIGNKQDAEDATQSVFIKLMTNNKAFADTEHEKAWLITTARNQCRDMHRKWWKKRIANLDSYSFIGQSDAGYRQSEIAEELRKLPAMQRLILYLYYYEGYKVAEIASMLDLKLNTVKTKMRIARSRLKLEMGDDKRE